MGTTTAAFDGRTISILQRLIGMNIDSVKGYRQAAKQVESPVLLETFRMNSDTREDFARELQALVYCVAGETPRKSGSPVGLLHRLWVQVQGVLVEGQEYPLLTQAERAEDDMKRAYEEVLLDVPAQPAREILQRQYISIRRAHDRIRELRDQRSHH